MYRQAPRFLLYCKHTAPMVGLIQKENSMDKKNYRHHFVVSVTGGKEGVAAVQEKIDAIGRASGHRYIQRGKVNRSEVLLDLITAAFDALSDPGNA